MEKTEYITREEAKMSHCNACSWYGICTDETMCKDVKAILAIPASKVKPIIYGKWRNTGSGQECSICKEFQPGYDSGRFYCPSCGADMRKE